MIDQNDDLYKDLVAVNNIPMIPTMLEVICSSTGMGFAAVARVTDERWLACCVRDEVKFGLEAGGELEIKSTLCNEIKDHKSAVVIDHVEKDEKYRDHHTPKMYGLQSYISFPIILKNGEFFGTLCAISPNPAELNNTKIIGMFSLFAELLSFHLQSVDLMARSHSALQETSRQLDYSNDENLQYRQISNHNLKEPLRKISLFSDMLIQNTENQDVEGTKRVARRIKSFAEELTGMMHHVTRFSSLNNTPAVFEKTDLNKLLTGLQIPMAKDLEKNKVLLNHQPLPVISAIPQQMEALFYHLINHAVFLFKTDQPTGIKIYSRNIAADQLNSHLNTMNGFNYAEVIMEVSGEALEAHQTGNLFDIFVHDSNSLSNKKYNAGLAYCRKIVHNHGGVIAASSSNGNDVLFSIILPLDYKLN